ncbi:MAG: hydrogenase maturation nickel metallochaperone HypA [Bacillota bacterium]
MHELALIQGVLESVAKTAQENSMTKISRIRLVVGKMTAALPASLEFCFNALDKSSLFAEACLEIEEVDIKGECAKCGNRFIISEFQFFCPACKHKNISIIAGRELFIDFFEGE